MTALLLSAAGSTPKGYDAWTPRLLLGRDPVELDPRVAPPPEDPEAAEKAARAREILAAHAERMGEPRDG